MAAPAGVNFRCRRCRLRRSAVRPSLYFCIAKVGGESSNLFAPSNFLKESAALTSANVIRGDAGSAPR